MLRSGGGLLRAPERQMTTMAIVIGLVTGLGAFGFSELVKLVEGLYFERFGDVLKAADLYWVVLPLLPMTGGLLVGLITYYFAPEAEGHGVPEVMDAMARKGGRIRPRVAGAKAVASALTIGSGGSAGTEGPIIQIGAAIGSGLGQWLRCNLNDIRVLIGCGAAAGIAAIFNAPIAGVLFAVEVLLRDVSLRSFVPIIIASVLSTTVTQYLRGSFDPLFPIPVEIQMRGAGADPIYEFSVRETANYAVLGLLCGLVAVGFVKALYFSEDVFRKLPLHRVLRPVLGALLLGGVAVGSHMLIGEHIPHLRTTVSQAGQDPVVEQVDTAAHPPAVMGNGYPVINQALEPSAYEPPERYTSIHGWTISVLLVLLVAKMLATCLTLGSGGSGGVFAPSLFIGAMTGGAFGLALEWTGWFPGITPGAYALVGMAAVVAASIHAPLTAALILMEMTRDYKIIVPIMLATVIGIAVAQRIEPASIYTLKLLRRGVLMASGDLLRLQRIPVRELPRLPAFVVHPEDPVMRLVAAMRTTATNDFLVADDDGKLVGMVLGDEVRTMLVEAEAMPLLIVSDVMRDDVPHIELDETLDIVIEKFAGRPMQSLPVMDPDNPGAARELITRVAVMNRYHQSLGRAARG